MEEQSDREEYQGLPHVCSVHHFLFQAREFLLGQGVSRQGRLTVLRGVCLAIGMCVPQGALAQAVSVADDFYCNDFASFGAIPGEYGWSANWADDSWTTLATDGVAPLSDDHLGQFGLPVDGFENFLLTGHPLWEDTAIEVTVTSADDDAVGLVTRYDSTESYYACWATQQSLPGCGGWMNRPGNFLVKVDGPLCVNDNVVEQDTSVYLPYATPFGIRLEVHGAVVTCTFDYDLDGIYGSGGDVILDYVDPEPLTSGLTGLAAYSSGEYLMLTEFDDVVIETWDLDIDNDGVPNLVENTMGSANADPDTDGDGIGDAIEYGMQSEPYQSDLDGLEDFRDLDSDGDSIPDLAEAGGPIPVDTDCDGVPDYRDIDSDNDYLTDDVDQCRLEFSVPMADSDMDGLGDDCDDAPYDSDQDNDGLLDGEEVNVYGTDPSAADSDCGGADDGVEVLVDLTDPLDEGDDIDGDLDFDGLTNCEETTIHGTDPLDADTDADGVPDGTEVVAGTDPLSADSDGDGLDDGAERSLGTDALDVDTDADGLEDGPEVLAGSDPLVQDTDGDGLLDGDEVNLHGTDPVAADTDGDGVDDQTEVGLGDTDGDTVGNALDTDDDGDLVPSIDEDLNGNLDPRDDDTDGDGQPNYLDSDDDGDGFATADEDWDGSGDVSDDDLDGDGVPSWLDSDEIDVNLDSDGDGIEDYLEELLGSDPLRVDSDGDGLLDGDEVGDVADPLDTDQDGVPDLIDADDDGDGVPTADEIGDPESPLDTDGDSIPNYLDVDSDNDDVYDGVDPDPLNPGGADSSSPSQSNPGFGLGCATSGGPVSGWFLVALLVGARRRS